MCTRLGAVMYEMLAGEPPFTGPTAQAVIAKMMASDAPSVRRARPSVPEAVDAAIRKALAPVPADRFTTAGEFAKALDIAQRTTASIPSEPARTTAPPVVAAAVVAAPQAHLPGFAALSALAFSWVSGCSSPGARAARAAAAPGGPVRLAVLPFDNLGDSADAYFADGVTDAVRGKLTTLSGSRSHGSGQLGSVPPHDEDARSRSARS